MKYILGIYHRILQFYSSSKKFYNDNSSSNSNKNINNIFKFGFNCGQIKCHTIVYTISINNYLYLSQFIAH